MPYNRKKEILFLIVAMFLLAGLVFFSFYACPFYRFFGIPCPGCGMTRALLSLLQGDFSASFAYHPLLLPVMGYACTAAIFLLCGRRHLLRSKGFVYSFLAMMLLFWAVRLTLVALGRSAVPFDDSALLVQIISWLLAKV